VGPLPTAVVIPAGPVADWETPEQTGVPPGPVSVVLVQVGCGCPDSKEVEKLVAAAVWAGAGWAVPVWVAASWATAGWAGSATAGDEMPAIATIRAAADTAVAASRPRRNRG
jgi:hypothetical protein